MVLGPRCSSRLASALVLVVGELVGSAHALQQSVKLNGPLAQPIGGGVGFSVASPDGTRLVYQGDQEIDDFVELYSVLPDGSQPPVKLSDPQHGSVRGLAQVTPDSTTVVYVTQAPALFRAPIDGSGPPVELAMLDPFFESDEIRFAISADSRWVVCWEVAGARLRAVPTDGSLPPVSLAPPGATVGSNFQLAPDSTCVVFRAAMPGEGHELLRAPIDGSSAPVLLGAPSSSPQRSVSGIALTPDGANVVYTASQDTPDQFELYRVALDGSPGPLKLSGALPANADASLIAAPVTPDSSRVAFRADTIVDERRELFSVKLDGSESPRRLNEEHASLGPLGVREARLTPDGRSVVYTTYGLELYGAPIDRSGAAQFLSQPGAYVDSYVLTTTGNRVVYRAQLVDDGPFDLFSASIGPWSANRDAHPSTTRRRLARDVSSYVLAPDGTTVLYHSSARHALYRVSAAGGAPVRLASGPSSFRAIPGGRVVFTRFGHSNGNGSELFCMPLEGGEPVRLSLPLPMGPVLGRIHDFLVSPDEAWTVYLADGETQHHYELYSVPSDGSAPAVAISGTLIPNGSVGGYPAQKAAFRITPDSTRVVYFADAETVGVRDLYIAPIDGSAAPTQLTDLVAHGVEHGGVHHGFTISPDGQHAVFLASIPVDAFNAPLMIHSVPLDGSGPMVQLNGPFERNANVVSFEVSPDSAWVVYTADADGFDRYELYSAPVDGTFAAIKLQAVTSFTADVTRHRVSPDGARVLYVYGSPGSILQGGELFTIPIDGSTARQRFLGTGDLVNAFEFTPGGSEVVFSQSLPEVLLHRAPIDASTEPVPLTASGLSNDAIIQAFRVTPDGVFVVFAAWQRGGLSRLFRVPMDGSLEFVRLSAPSLPPGSSGVWPDLRISADGSRVVFVADALTAGLHEIFSVPVAGGELPVRLNGPIAPGGGFDLMFPPLDRLELHGDRVVYALDQDTAGLVELFAAPLAGGSPPERLNAPLAADGTAALPFLFAGPERIVYLAPVDLEEVPELFSTSPGEPRAFLHR